MFRRLISMIAKDDAARYSPARRRAAAAPSRSPDLLFIDGAPPPMSSLGLRSIDNQAHYAHPMQLRRWIKEINAQMDDMHPGDREFALALLPKLQRLIEDR